MSKIKITILLFFISVIAMNPLRGMAQIDVAKNDLTEIYKSYDHLKYLSFDVTYLYDSDTLNGDFTHNEVKGSYKINGKNTLYKLGDVSFIQNDSILIGLYVIKKMIIVGDPQSSAMQGAIPMRQQMDSLLDAQGKHYTVTVVSRRKNTTISFIGADSLARFIQYDIIYDNSTDFIKKIAYTFNGITDRDLNNPAIEDSTRRRLLKEKRRKTFAITFGNYSFDKIDKENFDEKNYVVREDKIYKPAGKYNDYKVYNTKRKQ
jgi:hypothetical protein